MRDAFISYSTADSAEACSIRRFLQQNGCSCWMAPDDIPAGSDYADAIPKAIADCRTFVLVLSPNAQNSTWVRKELGKALDKNKTVIPFMISDFRLNDTFDFLLESAQWCYAYQNRDTAQKKLLAAVRANQSTYRYTPPPKTAPPRQTAPKAPTAAPKPTATQAKPRPVTAKSGNSKTVSRILYCLTLWGAFWFITALLAALCILLAENSPMGSNAFFLLGIGMLAEIILLRVAHKKDWIGDTLRAAKRGNILRKFLLWLVLGTGILVALVIIGGLTYLRITGQDSFTQDQVALLSVISGSLSLVIVAGWLKKYAF